MIIIVSNKRIEWICNIFFKEKYKLFRKIESMIKILSVLRRKKYDTIWIKRLKSQIICNQRYGRDLHYMCFKKILLFREIFKTVLLVKPILKYCYTSGDQHLMKRSCFLIDFMNFLRLSLKVLLDLILYNKRIKSKIKFCHF